MDNRASPAIGRRDLLRLSILASAVVATAVPLESALADSFTERQKTKPRYRESDDVRAFYRVNRY
jgi:hypothetical protein